MDIAIKEPDGIEYIHTIYLQEKKETHSLIYHTKYKRSMVTVRSHMHREKGTLEAHPPSYMTEDDQREYPLQWGMDPESDASDSSEWQINEWVSEERASNARYFFFLQYSIVDPWMRGGQ